MPSKHAYRFTYDVPDKNGDPGDFYGPIVRYYWTKDGLDKKRRQVATARGRIHSIEVTEIEWHLASEEALPGERILLVDQARGHLAPITEGPDR